MTDRHPILRLRTWLLPFRLWLVVAAALAIVYYGAFGFGRRVAVDTLSVGAVPVRQLEQWDDEHAFVWIERDDGVVERVFGPRGPSQALVQVTVEDVDPSSLVGAPSVAIFGSSGPDEEDKNTDQQEEDEVARAQAQEQERWRKLERLGYSTGDVPSHVWAPGAALGEYDEGAARELYGKLRQQGRTAYIEEIDDGAGGTRYRVHDTSAGGSQGDPTPVQPVEGDQGGTPSPEPVEGGTPPEPEVTAPVTGDPTPPPTETDQAPPPLAPVPPTPTTPATPAPRPIGDL
jgi:hypothetical protein